MYIGRSEKQRMGYATQHSAVHARCGLTPAKLGDKWEQIAD